MDKHILTRNGIVQAQVCSEGTYDEALEWINSENPAGTEANWGKDEAPGMAPVKCADDPMRTHYMFIC